jgi:cytochrome c oxidase cbb3-type subunit III
MKTALRLFTHQCGKASLLLTLFTFFSASGHAQAAQASDERSVIAYVLASVLLVVLAGIVVATLAIARLTTIISQQYVPQHSEALPAKSLWVRLRERFITGELLPVGEEQALVIDHSYDGIQELDNKMPPWLRYTFLGTIAFAVIYMVNFAFFGLVQTSEQEYVAEVEQAHKEIEAYKLVAAKGIDENNVQFVSDAAALTAAKGIYQQNCQACHGAAGEGSVGPNLTDEYWLHGGSIKDVFKTIKYGVPQKGMISWEQKLQPDQIQQLASYVLSLQGTAPANAKAPQGEKMSSTGKPEAKEVSMR